MTAWTAWHISMANAATHLVACCTCCMVDRASSGESCNLAYLLAQVVTDCVWCGALQWMLYKVTKLQLMSRIKFKEHDEQFQVTVIYKLLFRVNFASNTRWPQRFKCTFWSERRGKRKKHCRRKLHFLPWIIASLTHHWGATVHDKTEITRTNKCNKNYTLSRHDIRSHNQPRSLDAH